MESLIQLHNYRPHPTDSRHTVFIYHDYRMACLFEEQLSDSGLFFEKDVTESGDNKRYLYAVKNKDLKAVKKMNNLAIGSYRKPFIADPILRYVILAIGVGLMILVILGYLNKAS